ncbi:MAG: hypothetical protein ACJ8F7_03770 [Gemmataceae bacterium]
MPWTFDRTAYGPAVAALLAGDRLPELGPGHANAAARPLLQQLTPDRLLAGRPVRDADMARCCIAGLWLHHDSLDESHAISQEIDTPTGSYWHGILHRREPDYGNAKYWFRRVGPHPALEPLRLAVSALADAGEPIPPAQRQPAWDAFAFVDWCEECASGRLPQSELCRRVQRIEWQVLFDWCWNSVI